MALPAALKGPWNPLRITGTPMAPSLLLMCKILAVALLGTGHVRILPEPFLPFIAGLDELLPPATFRLVLQVAFVGAAVALLLNRWVRVSTLILGACLLLGVLCSKAYYGNNKTFVGLALVLAALSDTDRPAYLLRWQLSIVYFGAALNKLLDPDWQSGLFFEFWGGTKLQNPLYRLLAEHLPPLAAGKLFCWSTIVAEFAIAVGLLIPRLMPAALVINIMFQAGLLEFTGTTFTLFFYGMMAVTLAFVAWPISMAITYDPARLGHRCWRAARWLLDPDCVQTWRPEPERTLEVEIAGRRHTACGARLRLLLYSPTVWLSAAAMIALAPPDAVWWRRGFVAFLLVLFSPVLFAALRSAWSPRTHAGTR